MPEGDDLYERAQKMISFGPVTEKNVEQVRRLNLAVFPVTYGDKFYADLWKPPIVEYTNLAYFSDVLVGAICARVEPAEGSTFKVYIMTIGVLAPYRRLGIGKQLLEKLLETCQGQADCLEVYLHVQVNNDDAKAFYQKFGFSVGEVMKDYYKHQQRGATPGPASPRHRPMHPPGGSMGLGLLPRIPEHRHGISEARRGLSSSPQACAQAHDPLHFPPHRRIEPPDAVVLSKKLK